ncbi:MAG: molecular chaperone DnaJ [Sphingobacteriia bacterium 24-36-13]|jgi:molecular chaperone DnaJ|uniref:molecular chaperone DnaJ n=1 Tax=Sediminibacterium sp. TaxID=1917865 RepID=UPI000BC6ABDA|nr:molecular chaperone DnaJ [Sediminibacterium sp.]OYY11293.1 MAG: molecular chaperone DnaJ [Sphingobacteriia bacterium 35-36-14]OYZ53625.1 MAG: molecular chaperone DnaJ [Sphingobacteriia bacterium 24-36-13]OZA64145.1 MAG: molecular chaperone DnaJ [Sphingobacteriia bacterium 39-36-14]HQS23843.1 molecular chaperone DnaJ [Sediminibacterium sp.]HQS35114.1 molecular chaperone DnaJ [Sediminibacterium sp.]
MAKRDFYEILGVSKSASADEIKKAYRKTAMQFHPDRNPGDKTAEEKFKEAAEAYEVLSDADKKAKYDRYGHAAFGPGTGGGGNYGGGAGMNMDDIFSQFGDIFGDDMFGSFFGGGGRQRGGGGRQRGTRGSNLRIKLKLNYEEIAKGVTKNVKVKKHVVCTTCTGSGAKDKNSTQSCSTCGGSGQVRKVTSTFLGQMQTVSTCPSCNGEGTTITSKCGSCKGEGRVYGEETISIEIPAGVQEGMQLSMSGKGNAGERGGSNGDLIIQIEEESHEELHRDGLNVAYDLYISFPDAVFGTQVEVPTIDGRAKIKIPAGTQSGKIFRLKGKGFPEVQGYHRGDQLINVNVWTPQSVSAEEKQALEKFNSSGNFKPNPAKGEKSFFDRVKEAFS